MKTAVILQKILPPLWCGMVIAIAAEAQLKFRAPGITRELGLGIGKLVFTALNRAECVIAVMLALALFGFAGAKKARIVFVVIFIVLLTQTFWLMPRLIERIDAIVSGQAPSDSSAHLVYIALEVGKIALLLVLSILVNLQSDD